MGVPAAALVRGSSDALRDSGLKLFECVMSQEEAEALREFLVAVLGRGQRGEPHDESWPWHYSAIPPAFARRKQSREMVSFGSVTTSSNRVVPKSSEPRLPPLISAISDRLVQVGALESAAEAVTVNFYQEGNWVPPHIDAKEFARPFAVLSLDSGQVAFGDQLERDDIQAVGQVTNKDDSYAVLALPARSALCVDGIAANEWKHAVLPTLGNRISLVFRSLKKESQTSESAAPSSGGLNGATPGK